MGPLRMATMPAPSPTGQPALPAAWFGTPAGGALLASEAAQCQAILNESRGLPWLWLAPLSPGAGDIRPQGRGLRLCAAERGWAGDAQCALPLPLAGESIGTVILQHSLPAGSAGSELLAECARVLVPGGRLVLFALNPLAPYRWHWRGSGLQGAEPLTWRRRLREAGLQPELLSQGIGPGWRPAVSPRPQAGVGLRAAYLLRAEKRTLPLTPVRERRRLPAPGAVPAV
jgi:SAM-dependent methyltransferase